ncbi:MAG: hemerythrin domain-containing protein [Polyangiaceae bacterium]
MPDGALTEEEAALLLHEAVVTVLSHHHPVAHARITEIKEAVLRLGSARATQAWQAVLAGYGELIRSLRHHMHEEEETIFERVQLFHAKRELRFGALVKSLHRIDAMKEEHVELASRLTELAALRSKLEPERGDAAERAMLHALESFDVALVHHSRFEDRVIAPAFRLLAHRVA